MKRGNKIGVVGKWLKAGAVFTFLAACMVLLANPGAKQTPKHQVAWGSESINTLQASFQKISPIVLANACGLGATSCFKCHNGRRAMAPGMDPKKSPWHVQHEDVNYSCNGCHKGNPRIMLKGLAHRGMLKDPRSDTSVCASCHKDDLGKVVAEYKGVN